MDFLSVLTSLTLTISMSTPALMARCGNRLQVADTVVDHFGDSGIVGYHKSVEPPLTTQYIRHQHLLAVAGTPSTSLNEAITLPTPASTAAS